MKVIVIGATGTIGRAVADALATGHEVVRASRRGDVKVDIEDKRSIAALFQQVKDVDAVVSCAGNARFVPLAQLSDDDIAYSLKSKLLGQVELIRQALGYVREGGSVTVTSGVLAQRPMPGGAAISMVNAGLEGFVRGAAAEATRGVRVNAVSPPWVTRDPGGPEDGPVAGPAGRHRGPGLRGRRHGPGQRRDARSGRVRLRRRVTPDEEAYDGGKLRSATAFRLECRPGGVGRPGPRGRDGRPPPEAGP